MGRHKDSTAYGRRGTHFTHEERLKLQSLLEGKNGYARTTNRRVLAQVLHKSERTVYREIARGLVLHEYGTLPFERWEYNADYAQLKAQEEYSAKGPALKLGTDRVLVEAIRVLMVEKRYSPYAVITSFELHGWPTQTRISERTLYRYIHEGLIAGVSEQDLLYKGMRRMGKGETRQHKNISHALRSITHRPEEADERTEAGHGEIDTVVGGTGCSAVCLVTLTERVSRGEIVRRIDSHTQMAVLREVGIMERSMGLQAFRRLFRSVTADNGGEFGNPEAMEQSSRSREKRFTLYYAHPYSSFERGTNENHNGMIRRFIPKGSEMKEVRKKEVRSIQDWMNSYPRKILGGKTPIQKLQDKLGKDFILPPFLTLRTTE